MTKDEALKLGIESLEWHNQHMHRKISEQAISAMKEVLVQPEQDWIQRERAVGYREGHQNALKQMAQQAKPCGLECDCTDVCKQENYKALWQQMCQRCDELDKELAATDRQVEILSDSLSQLSKQQAKDEPVAWMYDWTTSEGEFIQNWTTSEAESLRDTGPNIITNVRPLYATPQPCPTCQALARTVMMDQIGRDL